MDQDDRSATSSQSGQAGRSAGEGDVHARGSPVSTNLDIDYWRTNYQHRPYVEPGATYEQYAPAYRYGAEMCAIYSPQGRTFDDVEPDLSKDWDQRRGNSRLGWDKAKHAVRDAWGRLAGNRSQSPAISSAMASGSNKDDHEVVDILMRVHHITQDGVKGFREAAAKLEGSYKDLLLRLADERAAIDRDLREQIGLRGGDPDKSGDTAGALHRGWIGLKSALGGGEKAIMEECERGEDAAVKTYQDALNQQSLPPDVEILLNRHYARIKNAHDQVRDLRDALKKT
jgi:uncharacterized protein (TIGR02284 family)